MESSGSSGYSSEDGVFDLTVGSLTVGQFWQAVQNWGVGGHQLAKISMRGTEGDIDVWNNQNPIPVNESMEEFLRDGTIAFNQQLQLKNLPQNFPYVIDGAVILQVRIVEPAHFVGAIDFLDCLVILMSFQSTRNSLLIGPFFSVVEIG
ncbi:unnamed protein product [Meloidogyne enterolobii]|uniref:Uncharacterized protein n=1 Tax=Meloidogyne enterolobii TaxID=390850 RepID=A0ACB1A0R6_MELEN